MVVPVPNGMQNWVIDKNACIDPTKFCIFVSPTKTPLATTITPLSINSLLSMNCILVIN